MEKLQHENLRLRARLGEDTQQQEAMTPSEPVLVLLAARLSTVKLVHAAHHPLHFHAGSNVHREPFVEATSGSSPSQQPASISHNEAADPDVKPGDVTEAESRSELIAETDTSNSALHRTQQQSAARKRR